MSSAEKLLNALLSFSIDLPLLASVPRRASLHVRVSAA
jgi:hypothetical protein